MKGLAIYLIVTCTVGILAWYSLDLRFYQLGVSIPYLIFAIIFLKNKEKYSDGNRTGAIWALILACIICVWDNLLRFAGFTMDVQSTSEWAAFLGRRVAIVGLYYIPGIVFSSIIIYKNYKHVTTNEANSNDKES